MPAEAYGIKRVVVTTSDSDVPLLQKNFYIAQRHGLGQTPGPGQGLGVGSSPYKSSPRSPGGDRGINSSGKNNNNSTKSGSPNVVMSPSPAIDNNNNNTHNNNTHNSNSSQKSVPTSQKDARGVVGSSPPSTVFDLGSNSIRLSKRIKGS